MNSVYVYRIKLVNVNIKSNHDLLGLLLISLVTVIRFQASFDKETEAFSISPPHLPPNFPFL